MDASFLAGYLSCPSFNDFHRLIIRLCKFVFITFGSLDHGYVLFLGNSLMGFLGTAVYFWRVCYAFTSDLAYLVLQYRLRTACVIIVALHFRSKIVNFLITYQFIDTLHVYYIILEYVKIYQYLTISSWVLLWSSCWVIVWGDHQHCDPATGGDTNIAMDPRCTNARSCRALSSRLLRTSSKLYYCCLLCT